MPEAEGEREYRAVPVPASTEGVPEMEEKKDGVERGGDGDSDTGEVPDLRGLPVSTEEAEGDPVADVQRDIEGDTDMEYVPDTVKEPAAAQ